MHDRAARDETHLRRGRRGRARVGSLLTAAGLLLACGESTPPAAKPFRGPGIGPITQDAVDPLEHPKLAEPGPLLPAQPSSQAASLAEPQAQAPANDTGEDKDKEPRDFPSELLQRLGNPASCLTPRPGDGNLVPIQISIQAQLMPSGALGRTELRAAELSAAERACLAQRVGAVRLTGPIDGAPLGIQASLTLQPSAAKAPASAAPAAREATNDIMDIQPSRAAEPPAFLEPSPEAKEVPAAPAVQFTNQGSTP